MTNTGRHGGGYGDGRGRGRGRRRHRGPWRHGRYYFRRGGGGFWPGYASYANYGPSYANYGPNPWYWYYQQQAALLQQLQWQAQYAPQSNDTDDLRAAIMELAEEINELQGYLAGQNAQAPVVPVLQPVQAAPQPIYYGSGGMPGYGFAG